MTRDTSVNQGSNVKTGVPPMFREQFKDTFGETIGNGVEEL